MATPIPSREQSPTRPLFPNTSPRSSEADRTVVNEPEQQHLQHANHKNRLAATNTYDSSEEYYLNRAERTRTYEENDRLKDDLTMLQAERVATQPDPVNPTRSTTAHRSRSRVEPVDAFDADTNPIHERMANYKPVEHPTTGFAKFFKRVSMIPLNPISALAGLVTAYSRSLQRAPITTAYSRSLERTSDPY